MCRQSEDAESELDLGKQNILLANVSIVKILMSMLSHCDLSLPPNTFMLYGFESNHPL